MRKYIDEYENRIPACLDVPWIKENILELLEGKATSMDIYRWRSSIYYPPVDMLIKLSEITRQPTAYLLGQTNVLKEAENANLPPVDIKEIMRRKRVNLTGLAARAGTSPATMRDLISKFPNIRTNSLIAIAEALCVSTDYLLGLTPFPRWEDPEPFSNIAPGEPAYIEISFTEEAKDQEGTYCLLGKDGNTVFMSDGTKRSKDDFKWCAVVPVKCK